MLVEVGRGLLTTCNGKEGVSREGRRSRAVPGRVRRRGTQSTGLGVRPGSGRERAGRGPGAGEAAGALPLWQEGQAGRAADGDRALTAAPSLSRALCVGDSTGRRRGRGGLRAGEARGRAVSAGKSGRLPGGGDLGLRLGGWSDLGAQGGRRAGRVLLPTPCQTLACGTCPHHSLLSEKRRGLPVGFGLVKRRSQPRAPGPCRPESLGQVDSHMGRPEPGSAEQPRPLTQQCR